MARVNSHTHRRCFNLPVVVAGCCYIVTEAQVMLDLPDSRSHPVLRCQCLLYLFCEVGKWYSDQLLGGPHLHPHQCLFAYGTLPQARMTIAPLTNGMAPSHHLGFLGVDLSVKFLPGILVGLQVADLWDVWQWQGALLSSSSWLYGFILSATWFKIKTNYELVVPRNLVKVKGLRAETASVIYVSCIRNMCG